MKNTYSKKTLEYASNPSNIGRMNDASGSAWIKGTCGDTMEVYLIIENNKITDAKFFTDGCIATHACGSAITELVINKTIDEILSISPKNIINSLEGLQKKNIHCSILAVSTLYKAITDYLLKY